MKDKWFFCLNENSPELTFKQNRKCACDPSTVQVRTVLILSGEKPVTYTHSGGGHCCFCLLSPSSSIRQTALCEDKPTQTIFHFHSPITNPTETFPSRQNLLFCSGPQVCSGRLWTFGTLRGMGLGSVALPRGLFTPLQGCPGHQGLRFTKVHRPWRL